MTITVTNQARAHTYNLGSAYKLSVYSGHANPPPAANRWFTSSNRGMAICVLGCDWSDHQSSFDVSLDAFSNAFLIRFEGNAALNLNFRIRNRNVIVEAK